MDLSYTPEQEMFRSSVHACVADRVTPARVAEVADGADGWDAGLWKEAVALGLAGISVPEASGGAGMGFVEEAIAADELGRGPFPGPWLGTVLAQPALLEAADLIGAVATGDRIASLAGLDVTAVADGHELSGRIAHVVDLQAADLVVVPARSEAGTSLFTVDRDDLEWRIHRTVDGTRRLGEISLERTPAKLLVEPGRGDVVLERTRVRALAALAAEAVGVASRVIELAIEHARTREQFGRPIGSFQAVSHQIADAFVETELARSLSMWAAVAVETDDAQAPRAAGVAKRSAAEAAVRTCERAIQVHGGVGFTWEHVLHRFYKRALWISAFRAPSRTT